MKFVPLNFLSTTSNWRLLLSSCSKSSGWIKSFTSAPSGNGFTKFPVIVPSSSFSRLFGLVTFAGIRIPLFKKLTTSIELGRW